MSPIKRTFALLLFAMLSAGVLGGCNTMAGLGEDVEAVGDSIEDEAEGHIDCDESDDC